MSNPWMAKLNKEKVSLKGLASSNGHKPSLAGLGKAMSSKPSLAGLKKKPLPKKQTKQDFYAGGLLYWNATATGVNDVPFDGKVVRPVGTVDVSNGDQTYTFHNRYGSWMADLGQRMAELAWVAKALGTNMSQVEMYGHVRDRFEAEMKVQKVMSVPEQQRRREEKAKAARSRAKPKPAAPTQPQKLSLKGLRK